MTTYQHEAIMVDSDSPPNPISGPSLSKFMVASVPKNASPQLNSAFDAIALATHTSMIALGFRLVGLGEDHRIEAHSEYDETHPLPAEWNAQNGSYAFRYKHSQSSMEYLVKVNRMGGKAVVMGMALGNDKTITFEATAKDYVSEGNLPLTIDTAQTEGAEKKMMDVFISIGRLSDFGSLMRVHLVQKLAPSLHKEGYQETQEGESSAAGMFSSYLVWLTFVLTSFQARDNLPRVAEITDHNTIPFARTATLVLNPTHYMTRLYSRDSHVGRFQNPCQALKTSSRFSILQEGCLAVVASHGSASEISTLRVLDPTTH